MKKSRILSLLFLLLMSFTLVLGLTSCGSDDNPIVENTDLKRVEDVMGKITLPSELTADMQVSTLTTGVEITWASNSPAITFNGQNLVVNRSIGEDVTVKVTATFKYNEVTKIKEFTVIVKGTPVEELMTIAQVVAANLSEVVKTKGIVSGFVRVLNVVDGRHVVERNAGFYITDATGTIYVFNNGAGLQVGQEVVVEGSRAVYTQGPSSVQQIGGTVTVTPGETGKTIPLTAYETLKVTQLAAKAKNDPIFASGKLLRMPVKVEINNYVSETVNSLTLRLAAPEEPTTYINEYVSSVTGSNAQLQGSSGYDYSSDFPLYYQYTDQVVWGYYATNGASSTGEGRTRGTLIAVAPADQELQDLISGVVTPMQSAVQTVEELLTMTAYNQPKTINLPLTHEGVAIAYTLKSGVSSVTFNATTGALVINPTATAESNITLTAVFTKSGEDTVTKTFTFSTQLQAIEYKTVAEARALANDAVVNIKGIVSERVLLPNAEGATYHGVYITDATATIYVYSKDFNAKYQSLNIGDEVELIGGIKSSNAQNGYTASQVDLNTNSIINVISTGKEVPMTADNTIETTIADLNAAGLTSTLTNSGKIYALPVTVKVDDQGSYINFNFYAIGSDSVRVSLYVSTPASLAQYPTLFADFYALHEQNATIYFVINSYSSNRYRGQVVKIEPLEVVDPTLTAQATVSGLFTSTYVAATEIDLPAVVGDVNIAYAFDGTPSSAAISSGKLTITPGSAQEDVILKVTYTIGDVVVEKQITFSTQPLAVNTHQEYLDAVAGVNLTVTGIVTAVQNATYDTLDMYIQNDDGGFYLYRVPKADAPAGWFTVGNEVVITGKKRISYDTLSLEASFSNLVILSTENTLPAPKEVTADFTTNNDVVKHQGTVVKVDWTCTSGTTGTVNGLATALRIHNNWWDGSYTFEVGVKYTVIGLFTWYNGPQITFITAYGEDNIVANMTDLDVAKMTVSELIASGYGVNAEIDLPATIETVGITYELASGVTSAVIAGGKLTITPAETEETVNLYVTYTVTGETPVTVTITFKTKIPTPVTINLFENPPTPSGTGTTVSLNVGAGAANAELFGLDPSVINISMDKGGSNTATAYHTSDELRLYASSGNGNTITFIAQEGYKIASITFDYYGNGSDNIPVGLVNEEVLGDGTSGNKSYASAFAAPVTQVAIKNTSTPNTQLRLSAIVIVLIPA